MNFFWMGLVLAVVLAAGCGPTPVTRQRDQANAEHFDLAAADQLLAREAKAVAAGHESRPAQGDLVVNEEVRLLPEAAAVSKEPAAGERAPQAEEAEPQAEGAEPAPAVPDEKAIQRALKNAGYYDGKIDGKIGPKTLAAIKKFQEERGLEVDGKVGPKTWAVLKASY